MWMNMFCWVRMWFLLRRYDFVGITEKYLQETANFRDGVVLNICLIQERCVLKCNLLTEVGKISGVFRIINFLHFWELRKRFLEYSRCSMLQETICQTVAIISLVKRIGCIEIFWEPRSTTTKHECRVDSVGFHRCRLGHLNDQLHWNFGPPLLATAFRDAFIRPRVCEPANLTPVYCNSLLILCQNFWRV